MDMERNITLITAITRRDITSEGTLWVTSVAFRVYTAPVITLCGVVTNVINILVFSRMGLRDGPAATFLVLSIADGLSCFVYLPATVMAAFRYLGPVRLRRSVYSLYFVNMLCLWLPKNASNFCTVVIAVVRCCSVAMPLRVKSVITVRRQLLAFFVLFLCNVLMLSFTANYFRLDLVSDPSTNFTHITATRTQGWQKKLQYSDIYRSVSFYLSFIIVNICLVVLIVSLKRSSQFRTKVSSTGGRPPGSGDEKINRRETQVVKTVVLVSAIFTVCNLPTVTMTILRQSLQGFSSTGYLFRSFDMLFMFIEMVAIIGASINIVVYLQSNSNYRKEFNVLFGIGQQKNMIQR